MCSFSQDPRLVCGIEHLSTNSTSVFFMQNDAARAKWSVSKNSIRRLRAAFAKSEVARQDEEKAPSNSKAKPTKRDKRAQPDPVSLDANWKALCAASGSKKR